jgi:glycosyltransferase involved in cell wall biosynthesis
MSSRILVSVLMTAYNREKYIAEAIESVLASTFKDFELIIVDDCSKDKTVEIARKYEALDSRVSVFVNEVNLGDYPNRNKAASYAKGKYIKYVDADDMIYPWSLDIIIKSFEKFPDAGYCLDSIEQDSNRLFPIVLNPLQAYNMEYFKTSIFNKAPTSSTIRIDVFQRVKGFSGKQMVGDFEMWHNLSLTEKVILLPHGMIWSRDHAEQESKLIRTDSLWLFKYMLVSFNYLSLQEVPLELDRKKVAVNRIKKSLSRSILRSYILELNISKAKQKQRLLGFSLFEVLFNSFKTSK